MGESGATGGDVVGGDVVGGAVVGGAVVGGGGGGGGGGAQAETIKIQIPAKSTAGWRRCLFRIPHIVSYSIDNTSNLFPVRTVIYLLYTG
jgi:hypothetical protein